MKAGNVDFGTTLVAAPSLVARQSSSSDLKYLYVRRSRLLLEPQLTLPYRPMAGFALSIGYNVPELVGKPPLVLDLYTVSLFFTGEITQWNDTRIQTYAKSTSRTTHCHVARTHTTHQQLLLGSTPRPRFRTRTFRCRWRPTTRPW